jgi:SAM-dependent methyltransferase
VTERPFYGSFAWAYDHLVDRPVARECAAVAAMLNERGVPPDTRVLDAGCGTGRYAVELAGRGYRVTGLDRSPELLAVARRRGGAGVPFVVGDLGALPLRRACGGVLCRGVLNDVLEDDTRAAIMRALAAVLLPAGVLVLDVRDWEATVRLKTRRPVDERTVATERGTLTFRSETRLDPATRRMLISERHVLVAAGETRTEAHEFVMRCWTREELAARLAAGGFEAIGFRPGYDPDASEKSSDRIVAIASRRPA